jgi:lipopolysaccharide biosynthesis glycosyltransferase
MATEFAISRFTVPFLARKGWALFLDCDVICLEDINNLFALADPKYAIMCVKHNQESGAATKMDGQVQLFYARKNWSSVMLWNCNHPANKRFKKEHLNSWPGRDLHAFKWLDDSEIGELPQKWNWLVHVTPGKPKLEGIWHYTLGGPWFPNWPAVDSPNSKMFDDVWRKESVLEKSEYVPPVI